MTASELVGLIPPKIFRELAMETNVDAQVKKLSGEVVFKLILFSMLNSEKLSLRVMETFLHSAQFKSFSQFDILDGKYNSIRDRICTINADYFETLFRRIYSIYSKELKEENALSKADSTSISIAAKLMTHGIETGGPNRKFVKYSVNLKGSIPSSVKVFTAQKYGCDEPALTELINDCQHQEGGIVVFDRGLKARSTYDKFTDDGRLFVSRVEPNSRCKTVETHIITDKPKGSTVTLHSEITGYLISKMNITSQHKYRIIKGTIDKSGNPICFVTNIFDEPPYAIAAWYRQRWDIEVFFKFIKQHLNAKHLVSRDINGIKVMLYMTLILATLIIAYKKINRIAGFKIAKLKFALELENEIIKAIVILCGGDPNKATHLFNST